MKAPTYGQEAEEALAKCKAAGFNLWPLIGIFKRRAKVCRELPDQVIVMLCQEYLKRGKTVKVEFPYFLQVLKFVYERWNAEQNINEHLALKYAPALSLKEIFAMAQGKY